VKKIPAGGVRSPQKAKAVKDAEVLVTKTKTSRSKSPVKKQAMVVEEKIEKVNPRKGRRSPRLAAATTSAKHMVKLAKSQLKGGDLEGGNLEGGELEGGNLEGGELEGGNLEGGDLEGGDLTAGELKAGYVYKSRW
jgi:hypothetical protein